jgi:hypothetical protein
MSGDAPAPAAAYEHGGGYKADPDGLVLRRFLIGVAIVAAQFVATELNAGLWWGAAAAAGWIGYELLQRRPQRVRDAIPFLLVAAYFGASFFVRLDPAQPSRAAQLIRDGAALIFFIGGVAASARFLITRWYDEDALAEEFGAEQGYTAARPRVPVRVRAALQILILAAALAVFASFYLKSLFFPE